MSLLHPCLECLELDELSKLKPGIDNSLEVSQAGGRNLTNLSCHVTFHVWISRLLEEGAIGET